MNTFLDSLSYIGVMITVGTALYFSYTKITDTVDPSRFHFKARRYLKFFFLICLGTVLIVGFDVTSLSTERSLILLQFSSIPVTLLLLLTTPLSIACREQWGKAFRHPVTKWVITASLAILTVAWSVFKFFVSRSRNRSGGPTRQGAWNQDGYLSYEEEAAKSFGEKY